MASVTTNTCNLASSPAPVPRDGGNLRPPASDPVVVRITDRKVTLMSETDPTSLYALCRRWVRNDRPKSKDDLLPRNGPPIRLPNPLAVSECDEKVSESSDKKDTSDGCSAATPPAAAPPPPLPLPPTADREGEGEEAANNNDKDGEGSKKKDDDDDKDCCDAAAAATDADAADGAADSVAEKDIEKMSGKELFALHRPHFVNVRKRFISDRQRRVKRYKPRLALLLPSNDSEAARSDGVVHSGS
ncbi:hypothetical protein CBR_g45842 [Chara braunii]|uniref:Uncharacterized protein n=1 Tax=Chara braunii TaxID=69332 RepID=A0A388LZD9_CHABU|nr:hypothetical protein CBR_g45842 [Chara braunii]|eukprot:GBG87688.1 hypothetical protein CBR_g45842 [Chara braunii]